MDDITFGGSPEEPRMALPDFVDLSQVRIPPTLPPFLIDGLLYQGDKLLVSSASKAGKSILLLELAYAVATGTEWLGYQCAQGTAVYVNFEIRANAFADRAYKIQKARGLAPDSGRLLALNLRGADCAGDGPSFVDALVERLATLDDAPSLIVIDPFYKLGAGDENAAGDVHRVLRRIDEVADVTGASVAVVHHHPKYSQGHKSAIDRASGSGVFGRDFDCILDLMQLDASKAMDEEIARREPEHFRGLGNHEQAQARYGFRQHAEARLAAWRAEAVCRHTAQPPPVNIWFDYPLHYVDETGRLAAAEYLTPLGGKATSRTEKKMGQLYETMDALAEAGNTQPTYAELEKETGLSRQTIQRYVEKSADYMIITSGKANRIIRKDDFHE
ncbi:MAG: AAA family ATPase [Coriobacteriales bacterium]|jgi:hypothetical protein|nr:AAA family ATPase [Coriobacteriales bacterium]